MSNLIGDTTKARIFYPNGLISSFFSSPLAYSVYIALDKGVRAAYRAAGDETPVYDQDYVDRR